MAAASSGVSITEPAERIISLLWLLLHEPRGYTREQIRRLVVGYEGQSDAAFEKLFQRDRRALRAVGVPLTTMPGGAPTDEDELEAVPRHRVDRQALLLQDLDLTVDERRALVRARRLWGDSPLRAEVVRAVGLLFHPGEFGGQDALDGYHTVMPRADPRLAALTEAAAEQHLLRFTYRDAAGSLSERTVRAWFLTLVRGRWYLTGWDTGRDAERSFRLSRMESEPTAVELPGEGAPPTRPADYDHADLRTRLAGRAETEHVRVWLAPGRGQGFRAAGERVHPHTLDGTPPADGWELWEVPAGAHEDGAVAEAAALAGAALFSAAEVQPARRLTEALRLAAEAHAGPANADLLATPVRTPVKRRVRTSSEDLVGRLLDIVGLANRADGIARTELQERLGITGRELDRDLEVLRYCGMPEREFPGFQFDVEDEDGRVRVHQSAELAGPVRLTLPEAHTLVATLQSVAEMTWLPDADRAAARSAQRRLRERLIEAGEAVPAEGTPPTGESHAANAAVTAGADEDAPAAVAAHWDVVVDPDTVRVLLEAIAARRVLRIRYHAVHSDAQSEREVEPLAVVQEGTHLYLQAWCRTARDHRVFRVDRIGGLEETAERFRPRPHSGPWRTHPGATGVTALVRWDHAVRDTADAYRPAAQATLDDGDRLTRLVLTGPDAATSLAARHGGAVEILDPPDLRAEVARRLDQAVGRVAGRPLPGDGSALRAR